VNISELVHVFNIPYGQPANPQNQELILNEMLAVANKYRVELFDVEVPRRPPARAAESDYREQHLAISRHR
jgi:hypothetical protein